ncbi:MAG: saccharopine dehydrogenase NADP-binding domain-containing protein [Anaerolineae bacterium]
MGDTFLLYGSTGFTGDLTARLAVTRGLRPILAGRSRDKLAAQAAELDLDYRVVSLDDAAGLDRALADVPVVLHCAGPYVHTSRPMADACLRTGAHYLDITGELSVYAALAARDQEARVRKVMLLPGVGFDVVPSDCLALHLKERLPTATRLALAFQMRGPARMSRGTALSGVEMAPGGGRVRRDERLVQVPLAAKTRQIDFGRGPVEAAQFPWGDVFTAYYSTGIPNIENYIALPKSAIRGLRLARYSQPLLKLSPVRSLLKRAIRAQPAGPTAEQRARTRVVVWGEVTDDKGGRAVARMSGPEPGYTWTPMLALTVVERVLAGDAPPGYQTPGSAYGADLPLGPEGVAREDVE